jgi:hypothetical protein
MRRELPCSIHTPANQTSRIEHGTHASVAVGILRPNCETNYVMFCLLLLPMQVESADGGRDVKIFAIQQWVVIG